MRKRNLFFTIIFCVVCFFTLPQTINAKEMYEEIKIAPTSSPITTQSATVQYDLAFPGILPDNPLYKLKVLRDKVSLALISSPEKKIEYLLLQADKGILATAMLVDKNKIELAKSTGLKAENNFTLLSGELWNLPKKPKADFFKKLETATLKHQEVLASLAKRVSGDDAKTFNTVIYFSKTNWESVKDYRDQRKITK